MYFLGQIKMPKSPSWRSLFCLKKIILILNHGLQGLINHQAQTLWNKINRLKRFPLSSIYLIRLYVTRIFRRKVFTRIFRRKLLLIRVKAVLRQRVWQVFSFKVFMALMVKAGDRIFLGLLGWHISLFYCLLCHLKFFRWFILL